MDDSSMVATSLGTSTEAVDVCRSADVIDLHVDTFIWSRILRYDMTRRHRGGPVGRRYLGQVDLPRALDAGVTGALWSITTNPFRLAAARHRAFGKHLVRLEAILDGADGVEFVRTVAEYRVARSAGRHGAFLAVQGGHAVADPGAVATDVVRITLVHLTSSVLGETSSPLRLASRVRGLTAQGRTYVESCNEHRVLVDLAHASPACFWQAVDVHEDDVPLIVTHTGVSGVHPSWRNLDDDQLRAVSTSGGCVGVMLHESFLAGGRASVETVADHLDHIVDVAGEDTPAIGTDLDGMVVPPPDLSVHAHFPRLVQALLDRKWPAARIHKTLGGNALRTIEAVRG